MAAELNVRSDISYRDFLKDVELDLNRREKQIFEIAEGMRKRGMKLPTNFPELSSVDRPSVIPPSPPRKEDYENEGEISLKEPVLNESELGEYTRKLLSEMDCEDAVGKLIEPVFDDAQLSIAGKLMTEARAIHIRTPDSQTLRLPSIRNFKPNCYYDNLQSSPELKEAIRTPQPTTVRRVACVVPPTLFSPEEPILSAMLAVGESDIVEPEEPELESEFLRQLMKESVNK